MVIDSLAQAKRWECVNLGFKQVFRYLKSVEWETLPPGRIVLDEGRVWLQVEEPLGREAEEARLEAHDRFIDIQLPLAGEETFGWSWRGDLRMEAAGGYDGERDIVFYDDRPAAHFTLRAGQFAIFFPEDAHAPCIGQGRLRKIVAKVAAWR